MATVKPSAGADADDDDIEEMQGCTRVPRGSAQCCCSRITPAEPWGARLECARRAVSAVTLTHVLEFLMRAENSTVQPILSFIDNCSLIAALLASVSGTLLSTWTTWLLDGTVGGVANGSAAASPANRLHLHSAVWAFLLTLFTLILCALQRASISLVANLVHVGVDGRPLDAALLENERRRQVLAELRFYPFYGLPVVLLLLALCFLTIWTLLYVRAWLPSDFVWLVIYVTVFCTVAFSLLLGRYVRHISEISMHRDHEARRARRHGYRISDDAHKEQ